MEQVFDHWPGGSVVVIRFVAVLASMVVVTSATHAESPDPAALAVPPEQVARAKELVRLLGSPEFRDRDRATRDLARMGRLALPALSAAVADSDTEVRLRVGWLLPRAEADDMRAKLDAFLADTEGRYRHSLPGWDSFRATVGEGKLPRGLFAEIVKNPANRDLLLALRPGQDQEAELARAISARRQAIYLQVNQPLPNGGFSYRGVNPEAADLALLYLAESLVSEKRLPVGGFYYSLSTYLYRPEGRELMAGRTSGTFDAALRRLILHWLDTRDGASGVSVAMSVAQTLNLDPATIARYAARVLTAEGVTQWNRAQAATVVARYGGKAHLPAMTNLFTDTTRLVFGANGQAEVQVRDVALAMALEVTGQDPKSYGFDTQPGANASMRFSYTYHRFHNSNEQTADQKRAAAFARWQAWEAQAFGSVVAPSVVAAGHLKRFAEKK